MARRSSTSLNSFCLMVLRALLSNDMRVGKHGACFSAGGHGYKLTLWVSRRQMTRRCSASSSSRCERARCHDQPQEDITDPCRAVSAGVIVDLFGWHTVAWLNACKVAKLATPPQRAGESRPRSPCFTTDISSDPRYRCPSGKQPPRVGRSRGKEEECESSSAAEPAQSARTARS
jgi:hypothetical protein